MDKDEVGLVAIAFPVAVIFLMQETLCHIGSGRSSRSQCPKKGIAVRGITYQWILRGNRHL